MNIMHLMFEIKLKSSYTPVIEFYINKRSTWKVFAILVSFHLIIQNRLSSSRFDFSVSFYCNEKMDKSISLLAGESFILLAVNIRSRFLI